MHQNIYPRMTINFTDDYVILRLTPLRYYTQNDEDLMFTWFDKIKSVKDYAGSGRELYVYIASKDIPKEDLLDLMGLFGCYRFNAQQLEVFKNDDNKNLFKENY